jgi:hypothetical protein
LEVCKVASIPSFLPPPTISLALSPCTSFMLCPFYKPSGNTPEPICQMELLIYRLCGLSSLWVLLSVLGWVKTQRCKLIKVIDIKITTTIQTAMDRSLSRLTACRSVREGLTLTSKTQRERKI